MLAGIYLRQSLDRTGAMVAISRQRPPCVALCEQRGWPYREYVDNDISASKDRPESDYERLIADVEAGVIQAIVSLDLDRLYRRPKDLEYLIDLAEKDGLLLATIGGDADLSTDSGRLFARIKAAVAKAEMERKSARQKLMHEQRAAAGLPWGDRRTFGFTLDHDPHPTEAPLVAEAYGVLLAGGSLGSIAARWNDMGVTTSLGNQWNGPAVSQLLRNPAYAGLRARLGEVVGPAKWKPIVEPEVWQAARVLLSSPERNLRPGSRARKHWLTGIALCGSCPDRPALGSGQTFAGKVPRYVCKRCYRGRNLAALDDHITDLVVGRLSRPDAVELLIDTGRPDLTELREESARLQGRLDALAAEFAEGELDRSQLRTGTQLLKGKLAKIDAAMADSSRARIFQGVIGADDVAATFAGLSLARRRAIVSSLMKIIVLPTRKGARFDPADVRIEWLNSESAQSDTE